MGDLLTRKLSTLLFNVYMDNLSVQLHTKSIGCSLGTTVINHLIYADDLLLFAPSDKGLQTLLDCCYIHGCEYDVIINAYKSLIIYFDSRNANLAREMTLGRTKLNFVTSCKYLGHVIYTCSWTRSFMLRATCYVKKLAFTLLL